MNNKIIAFFLLITQLFSITSFAGDGVPSPDPEPPKPSTRLPAPPQLTKDEIDVGEAISPMKKGQIAPFTGVLLSPAAVAKVIADIESRNDAIKVEVKKATSTLQARHDHEKTVINIRNEADTKIFKSRIDQQKREIDSLEFQIKNEREDRPNPATWTAIGLATGVVLSTLAAVLIVSVSQNN